MTAANREAADPQAAALSVLRDPVAREFGAVARPQPSLGRLAALLASLIAEP